MNTVQPYPQAVKHSKTLELTEKLKKYVLHLTANCNSIY